MFNTRKWNLLFRILSVILIFVMVLFMIVGSNVLDLLYLGIIFVFIFKYVVDKLKDCTR